MKILVTGGAGFIGSHLVDGLIDLGHEAVVVDDLSAGAKDNLNKQAVFYKISVCDQKIKAIFEKEKPDVVYHLAARINVRESVKDPAADARVNVIGSLNILENARLSGVKKFVFTSTGGAIYGEASVIPTPETYREEPLSPYGVAKLAVEKYLYYYHKVFGLNYAVLRLANVYGPRQNSKGEAGVVAIFCDKMLSNRPPVIFGSGDQSRDFVYVGDVARAHIKAMDFDIAGTFNIGTGVETDINAIYNLIAADSGFQGEKIHAQGTIGEQARSCLDNSKAKDVLGWKPEYAAAAGVAKTVAWFKARKPRRRQADPAGLIDEMA